MYTNFRVGVVTVVYVAVLTFLLLISFAQSGPPTSDLAGQVIRNSGNLAEARADIKILESRVQNLNDLVQVIQALKIDQRLVRIEGMAATVMMILGKILTMLYAVIIALIVAGVKQAWKHLSIKVRLQDVHEDESTRG